MPCVFCRRDVPLSAEHVIPQWTRPFLGWPGDQGTHTHLKIRGGREVEKRSHSAKAATQTVRSVCADCNTRWMSRLEGAAKPYLLSILEGHTRTYYEGGQRLIATWLVKTALMVGSRFRPKLPSTFYEQLYDEQRPSDNTRIWLAGTAYVEHHQSDFRPFRVHPQDEPPPAEPNAVSAMVAVGQSRGCSCPGLIASRRSKASTGSRQHWSRSGQRKAGR